MRIVIVTDSHLAASAPACNDNWRAVREYVTRSAADLTVHLGDISLDAVSDGSQLETARAMCDPWPSPFRFLPGNHDIGDNPLSPEVPARHPLETGLIERYRANFGADFWAISVEGWYLIGVDAQLFGSNIAFEYEQWRWLDDCVGNAGTRPVALMLHKPLLQNTCADSAPHIRYVPIEPRRRLLNLIAQLNVQIVLSGHTHQYLDRRIEGVRHVWVPSTAFFIPDTDQDRIGEKVTGLGLLELNGDDYRFDLVCPDRLARNNFVEQPFYTNPK
jgi:3',5'-cyclic AMP phosphodiesterase CpdA